MRHQGRKTAILQVEFWNTVPPPAVARLPLHRFFAEKTLPHFFFLRQIPMETFWELSITFALRLMMSFVSELTSGRRGRGPGPGGGVVRSGGGGARGMIIRPIEECSSIIGQSQHLSVQVESR